MRIPTSFRGTISRNAGDTHAAEPNRYHLYVSSACPWAHRTLMVRALKGLTKVISVDVVHPYLTERGWSFETDFPGATGDSVGGLDYLQQVYRATASDYAGVVTVPVLFDKKLQTIVNNESAEIIRMLNAEFNAVAEHPEIDLYPEHLRHQIDEINSWIYPSINNGVYRSGFAQTQAAHEQAVNELFEGLDRVERLLQTQPMLCGDELTEADIRLFTTLIRFDAVYHTHFKCNRKLIAQYPAMHRYMAKIYQLPGIAETVDMDQIRYHYFYSHRHINPTAIVPRGPDVVAALQEV
ncbi:MAG: glutathione S-transferase family protein [Oxalobacteraceae bacterium]|nr:glutathione S-transferase family protein [Oxalobacteraceae bacterium]